MLVPFLLLSISKVASATLIGALLSPHGGALLVPSLVQGENQGFCTSHGCASEAQKHCQACAERLHSAAISAVEGFKSSEPDLVVLTTPHSEVARIGEHVVYEDDQSLEGESDAGRVTAHTSLASHKLVDHLKAAGVPARSESAQHLGWAELIPLWFLPASWRDNVIIIALSGTESCRLGQELASWLEHLDGTRALWIVSGDLSHYHGSTHGCDGAPYAASDTATPFEGHLRCWASGPQLDSSQLQHALRLDAGSCASDGLQSLDCGLQSSNATWTPCVREHGVCTYFGMMVATFFSSGEAPQPSNCLPCEPPPKMGKGSFLQSSGRRKKAVRGNSLLQRRTLQSAVQRGDL